MEGACGLSVCLIGSEIRLPLYIKTKIMALFYNVVLESLITYDKMTIKSQFFLHYQSISLHSACLNRPTDGPGSSKRRYPSSQRSSLPYVYKHEPRLKPGTGKFLIHSLPEF